MPAILALILCIIFVLFLLRLDRKQFPEASISLWLPTIWMLMTFSKPLAIWFQSTGETIEEGNPLDRAFLTALFCLGLIILTKRRFNWANAVKENIWLMLLIVYMLVSCLWSDIPFISFKRWSKELVAVVMAFVVASEPDPRKSLESIFRRTIYILIPFSYILIQYFSEYGRMYIHHSGDLMWVGAAMHKNTLAQLCLFAAIFLIWTFIRRHQGKDIPAAGYKTILEVFILILAFWMWGGPQHTFTYSATATVAFTVGLSFLIFLFWAKKWSTVPGPKALIVLTALIIIYGTVTPMLGELSLLDVSSMLGREENLTGRTAVWKELVPVAMESPILGYGFGGFWSSTAREEYQISGAHNGYLDLILELGFVGLLLYTMFVVSNARKAQRLMTQDFDWGTLWMCYLLMGLLINITEASFNSFTTQLLAVILFLTVSCTSATTQTRESRKKHDGVVPRKMVI
jgi:exopolysaccharide production protein ExoQ